MLLKHRVPGLRRERSKLNQHEHGREILTVDNSMSNEVRPSAKRGAWETRRRASVGDGDLDPIGLAIGPAGPLVGPVCRSE